MASKDEIKLQLDHILTQVATLQNIEYFELNSDTSTNFGDGFIGQFFPGEIQNKDTGKTTSVAIKISPVWDFGYSDLFNNENLFYKTVFPALVYLQKETGVPVPFDNVPNYFCGSMESKKEFIAMENLKPLGYVMFDKKQFFDQEHLEFIFKTYGKFHALSFVFRKKNLEEYQKTVKDLVNGIPALADLVDKQLTAAISATINFLNTEKDKIVYDAVKNLAENIRATFIKASEYDGKYSCLVHGDCWSNNMLFKYSESGKLLDVKLIDFQLCRDTTPIHDLSYFFYSGASKEDFDNIEYYLQIYYNSFVEFAKELDGDLDDLLSFDDLVVEWKENALLGVMFAVWVWEVKIVPKEKYQELITGSDDIPEEEKRKIWKEYMESIYKSDVYRERTTPILIHAFEYGVLNNDKIVK